jgi:glycosyltransferase involved in cell wall biosynthesis
MINEMKPARVLALIPAHNESGRIAPVIDAVKKKLPVLVVDDGSTDNTSEVAREHGAIVIRQEPNQGKGAALLKGFRYFLVGEYDAVLTLDADGQHDPAEIPLFLGKYEKDHADLIIGRRDFRKMPFPRNISNTIGTRMFSNALKVHVPDNQSGYRLHSRRLVESAINSQEHGFEFEVEIIFKCVLEGYRLDWVPIKTIYFKEKHTHIKPLHQVKEFFRITKKARNLRHLMDKAKNA